MQSKPQRPINPHLVVLTTLLLAVLGAGVATATTHAEVAAPNWSAPHQVGQLIIRVSDDLGGPAESRLTRAGLRVIRTIPALDLAVVEPRSDSAAMAAATLLDSGIAEWVEPNYTFQLDLAPNDPHYAYQVPYLDRINVEAAWDLTVGRSEIIVAVLDTGVDKTHPDLQGGFWTNAGEIPGNGTDDDGNGFIDDVEGWNFPGNNNLIFDDHGHGTHVSGIVAARTDNGIGIAGVAGGVTIMPVDVFGGGIGTYADLIEAIVYATDNGADVINMSLGANSYSLGEQMAVDYAWKKGVVVVAAAGNTYRETHHYPAAHENVIAVASTTAYDSLSDFSTRGPFVDVAAPGTWIWSTYPGGYYTTMSGTSMASPHVAGLAALILSLNPHLTPDEVRVLIEGNVDDLGDPGWDKSFGHGRINAGHTLAAVTPNAVPWPDKKLDPPLDIWPDGCWDLIPDGDFEGNSGEWQFEGDAWIDSSFPYSGTVAAHFSGSPDSRGVMTRTVTLPADAQQGVLWFVYRISTYDSGWGTGPELPFDDVLRVELQRTNGELVQSLLRSGNTGDNSSDGLPWDFYLYRLRPEDLAPLVAEEKISLVFTATGDGDNYPTDYWVDDVRFCVHSGYTWYYPLFLRNDLVVR